MRVHATFLLLLAFWGWQGYVEGGRHGAIEQILSVSFLFFCVLLHEFGHGLRGTGLWHPHAGHHAAADRRRGRLERMPENPAQELVIAIAGPMVNVAIAGILWIALGMPAPFPFPVFDSRAQELAFDSLYANLFLVVFNLIPAFPMDGGRVLRAVLSFWIPYVTATKIAARIGQGIAAIFAVVGLFGIPGVVPSNPFLLFIAMFVFMARNRKPSLRACVRRHPACALPMR